jgi:hypothetical protein
VLDFEERGGVVDGAVLVVVVADGAVEEVIAEDAVEGFALGGLGSVAFGFDLHVGGEAGAAGASEFAVHFDHAGVAGLDGAELLEVADLGEFFGSAIDGVDEGLAVEALIAAAIHNEVDGGGGWIGDTAFDVEKVRGYDVFQTHKS